MQTNQCLHEGGVKKNSIDLSFARGAFLNKTFFRYHCFPAIFNQSFLVAYLFLVTLRSFLFKQVLSAIIAVSLEGLFRLKTRFIR